MQTKIFHTPYYSEGSGRGESLVHWLYDSDLYLPSSVSPHLADPAGNIVGAIYGHKLAASWVIFYGLQVIQIVPEEVHSYWHNKYLERESARACVWEIEDSTWLASFHPRHLEGRAYKHYIIIFYDELVEVICRDLIFGSGLFDIAVVAATDARFNDAYFRYAEVQAAAGNYDEAAEYYQKFIDSDPSDDAVEYAQNCMASIRNGTIQEWFAEGD